MTDPRAVPVHAFVAVVIAGVTAEPASEQNVANKAWDKDDDTCIASEMRESMKASCLRINARVIDVQGDNDDDDEEDKEEGVRAEEA